MPVSASVPNEEAALGVRDEGMHGLEPSFVEMQRFSISIFDLISGFL